MTDKEIMTPYKGWRIIYGEHGTAYHTPTPEWLAQQQARTKELEEALLNINLETASEDKINLQSPSANKKILTTIRQITEKTLKKVD